MAKAEGDIREGGEWSIYDGNIHGKYVELKPVSEKLSFLDEYGPTM